jgi:hypothetical protein
MIVRTPEPITNPQKQETGKNYPQSAMDAKAQVVDSLVVIRQKPGSPG